MRKSIRGKKRDGQRCCGYLTSRKLEALAQQLVAMGFPSERATMALILNEGKLEESVAWLFEGGEDSVNQKKLKFDNGGGGNFKVDISQELAQIADMEVKFKCSKQEVERVVVACEGDLEKAADNLFKLQKADPPKPEETCDPVKPSVSITQTSKVRSKQNPSSGAMSIQQKADHRDTSYTTMAVTTTGRSLAESPGVKNIQMLKKVLPATIVEKRWGVGGMQTAPPPLKTETQCMNGGNALKNLQIGSVREPVTMMQLTQARHPQTTNMSSSPSSSGSYVSDWKSNGVVEPVLDLNPNGVHIT
ncbi:hypothetical protein L1987_74455 [Smallanthus sonchifolius]|uniref:Uncharacterized protein n=1 Tax=Smallanthus sonchifolius TaxID=185202 RepID=A0ACB9A2Q4_9ASTR|nr:hypothetical protein L1987_74455 [Smallanthus sonchifolius]